MIKIYFAGPLFTHAERVWNNMVGDKIRYHAKEFELEIRVFLPQAETSHVFEKAAHDDTDPNFEEVMRICLQGINDSNVLIAVLDGADSDSGTCFECGYAYALGKPVIGIRTDVRSGEDEGINAMLTRSCKEIVRLDRIMTGSQEEITILANRIINAVQRHGME